MVLAGAAACATAAGRHGAVVLHGQGESAARVADIAEALRRENVLVASPELPWSGRRRYDRVASEADAEIDAAIRGLREQDARRIYVLGEGVGASYAVRYASRPGVDGIVVIAPNHAPESPLYTRSFSDYVRKARDLIAAGKPQALIEFVDRLWGDRRNRVTTSARSFVSYFDAAGSLNLSNNVRAVPQDVVVLWIVPAGDRTSRDYALEQYRRLPHNPGSRLVELPVDYANVPRGSVPAIVQWMHDTVPHLRKE
jgi:hypothetical protein